MFLLFDFASRFLSRWTDTLDGEFVEKLNTSIKHDEKNEQKKKASLPHLKKNSLVRQGRRHTQISSKNMKEISFVFCKIVQPRVLENARIFHRKVMVHQGIENHLPFIA